MQVCFAASIAQIGSRLFPAWPTGYFIWVAIFITLEVLITHRATIETAAFSPEWLGYRVAEWIFNLLVVKIILYAVNGFAQIPADLLAWQRHFLVSFFNNEMIVATVFAMLVWFIVSQYVNLLHQLEHDPDLLDLERVGYALHDRKATRQQLMNMVFTLGAIMLILTALLNIDTGIIQIAPATNHGYVWLMFAYFVFGLALLAQTQFDVLRSQWYLNRIPVSPNLAVRWAVFAGAVLIIFTLLAGVLPTRYSLGFLAALGWLITLVTNLYLLLQLSLLAPFVGLLRLIVEWLGFSPTVRPPQPLPTPEPLQPSPPASGLPLLDVLRSIIFWVVFVGVIGFFLFQYVRQRQDWVRSLSTVPWLAWTRRFWLWLVAFIRKVPRGVASLLEEPFQRLRGQTKPLAESLSRKRKKLSPNSPRESVFFTYWQMLQENASVTLGREPAQTPDEYGKDLRQKLPDAAEEISELTDRFIEARYTSHEVSEEEARTTRSLWQRFHVILVEHLQSLEERSRRS
jgi:hypothetical protein